MDDSREILQKLVTHSGALSAVVISRDGHAVVAAGDDGRLDTTSLAALVAGMFSATREVARLIGEDEFAVMLQQGKRRNIHISLISDDLMLVIVFEGYEKIGLVRHESRKVAGPLADSLAPHYDEPQPQSAATAGEFSIDNFREYALNLIDRLFESK